MTKPKHEQPMAAQDYVRFLVDCEDFGRAQEDRDKAFKALASELGPSDAALVQTFERINQGLAQGLTLAAAGILSGVTRRTLAAWVKMADDRRKPWSTYLDGLLHRDAQRRTQQLGDLRTLAQTDARCYRDWVAHSGRPSPLEYELQQLRKVRGAATDAILMPSNQERNAASKAVEPAGDIQSVAAPAVTESCSEKEAEVCNSAVQAEPGGEA